MLVGRLLTFPLSLLPQASLSEWLFGIQDKTFKGKYILNHLLHFLKHDTLLVARVTHLPSFLY